MNMAFTAGCLFMLQCIFLIDISVANPLIDASPSEITLGITSKLDVNCIFSLNTSSDMTALISLVLSRASATRQDFQDLAVITLFSPDSVKIITEEKVSATGVFSQTGDTFLHLTWQYPTAVQGGVYKCSALGLDVLGRAVGMTNTTLVTVEEANLKDIFEKLQQLEMHESSMRQQIQTLKDNNLHLEGVVASLAREHVDLIGTYGNKNYYASGFLFTDINIATDVCKLLGGTLAIIDDQDEFTAVQSFRTNTSGHYHVVIAGSDELSEGHWVLPDTNTSLPFTAWGSGRPFIDRRYNCLWLNYDELWAMHDWVCHDDSPPDYHRFLCEV